MGGIEQRKEKRYSVDELPKEYSEFSILLGHGSSATVKTIDASLNGFGFKAELQTDSFVLGSKIVLFPLGQEHPVYGIVVYSREFENGTKVGVLLQHLGGYAKYTNIIHEVAAKEAQNT